MRAVFDPYQLNEVNIERRMLYELLLFCPFIAICMYVLNVIRRETRTIIFWHD